MGGRGGDGFGGGCLDSAVFGSTGTGTGVRDELRSRPLLLVLVPLL